MLFSTNNSQRKQFILRVLPLFIAFFCVQQSTQGHNASKKKKITKHLLKDFRVVMTFKALSGKRGRTATVTVVEKKGKKVRFHTYRIQRGSLIGRNRDIVFGVLRNEVMIKAKRRGKKGKAEVKYILITKTATRESSKVEFRRKLLRGWIAN